MAKFDIKKTAFEHVEKIVFGLLVLIVLLGLFGTRWIPYRGTPEEITTKVSEGRKVLLANRWPEDEAVKYKLNDEDAPAHVIHERLVKKIDPAGMELSGRLLMDPFGSNEPVREPETLPCKDLIATSGRAFLHMNDTPAEPEAPMEEPATAEPKAPIRDDNLPDDLRPRQGTAGGGEMVAEQPLEYGRLAAELGKGTTQNFASLLEEFGGAGGKDAGKESESAAPAGPVVDGKGYHLISVRAVFPLRDQIHKFADAIHRSYQEAASAFDIRDFELERQTKQPGKEPWSGPWEKVDMDVAEDILNKSAGFDADVVDSIITNGVITMPLPMRISGQWLNTATHPDIKDFVLSEDQMAMEVDMQRKLIEQAAEQGKKVRQNSVKRAGFSAFQFDTREVQADLTGTNPFSIGTGTDLSKMAASIGINIPSGLDVAGLLQSGRLGAGGGAPGKRPVTNPQNELVEKMIKGEEFKDPQKKKEMETKIREWLASRLSAEGELLLFRYLDFSVEPGQTYRYRVRLVLANPNFGKRISDAGGMQDVVEGETRTTPWSNVTEPAYVDTDVNYYLADIRETAARLLPSARFDVFQWDPNHGTYINGGFEVQPAGQQMAEEVKTTVIDPAKSKFDEEKYQFTCRDYLVDVLEDVKLDAGFHEKGEDGKTVKLPPGPRGQLHLAARSLVKAEDGRLRMLSPAAPSQEEEHIRKKYLQEKQAEQFADLKPKEEPAEGEPSPSDQLPSQARSFISGMGVSDEVVSGFMKKGGGKSRLRSQLRKLTKKKK